LAGIKTAHKELDFNVETLRDKIKGLLSYQVGKVVDANDERIQLVTPFIRPNGESIDVFLVKKDGGFILSDFADTWEYRRNLTGGGDPQFDTQLLERLGVKRENGQLVLEVNTLFDLPQSIILLATACMYSSVGT